MSITSIWDRLRGRRVTATCRQRDELDLGWFGPYYYTVTITDRHGVTGTYEHPVLSTAKFHADVDLRANRRIAKDHALFVMGENND